MKKFIYNSLTAFYNDMPNVHQNLYGHYENYDSASFKGLSNAQIVQNKFSYAFGVEKLKHLPDFEILKPEWQKYFNSFDGFDIDIDRMHDGLDFLIERRKHSKLPKTMDIYVNFAENASVDYEEILNKTYAALKIIDFLETQGVRVALFAVCYSQLKITGDAMVYLEIKVKDYPDPVNLGALCTAISPWMLRHWTFLWFCSKFKDIRMGLGYAKEIPNNIKDPKAIYIDNGQCLSQRSAISFVEKVNIQSNENKF